MNRGQQVTLLGALGLLVGALLPWAKISSPILGLNMSQAGYEGDGLITGAVGLIVLLIALLSKGKPGKFFSIGATILSAIAALILWLDLTNVNDVVANTGEGVIASVGPGIYLSIVGAILALVGGLQKLPLSSDDAQETTGTIQSKQM